MSDSSEEKELRAIAVQSFVANAIGLAVQIGLIVAIAKRDWVKRQFLRYRWHVMQEWRGAHERRLIAELRRDLSRIEHENATEQGLQLLRVRLRRAVRAADRANPAHPRRGIQPGRRPGRLPPGGQHADARTGGHGARHRGQGANGGAGAVVGRPAR